MPFRVPLLLWFMSLPGVAAVALLVVPQWLAGRALPFSMSLVQFASGLQSAVLVALAAAVGAWLAPRVGLRAPVTRAAADRTSAWAAARPQLVPALVGGVASGVALLVISGQAPPAIVAAGSKVSVPLVARVLYGGVTEEVLVRWGLMSALAWVIWRAAGSRSPCPAPVMWCAIVLSAAAFGAAHLPATRALVGTLDADLVAYVLLANGAFGVIAGWLFWRYGLEAAILAHMTAHCVLAGLGP